MIKASGLYTYTEPFVYSLKIHQFSFPRPKKV